jgi:hypothetical protein
LQLLPKLISAVNKIFRGITVGILWTTIGDYLVSVDGLLKESI